jgi:uncharacterized protein YdaU (DUF1376 family)
MYPTDFEADTSHLTLAEDGAYNRLLRLMWMTSGCSLPDDAAWIKRRMRCTDDEFSSVVLVVIDEFFSRKSGRVFSPRLAREFQKSDVAHKRRVDAGSKGGKAKSALSKDNSPSNAKAMPKQPEPEPEPYKKESTNVLLCEAPPAIDGIAEAVSAYNATADRTGWPKVQKLSPARRAALRGRLKDCDGPEGWQIAIAKAEASSFLTGQTSKPFMASFDFITKQSNFTKIMEGNYDDRSNPNSPQQSNSSGRSSAHNSLMGGFADAAYSGQ